MNANESALQNCLFFTANRLSNVLRRLANDAYAETGVATSHLYLLIIVYQYPGISITELSEKLDVAPSTCTRFVDALVKQEILSKEQEWKTVHVFLTDHGIDVTKKIDAALSRFAEECIQTLGEEESLSLAAKMWNAANRLSAPSKK